MTETNEGARVESKLFSKILGANIRLARKRSRLTQKELATKLGVQASTMNRFEAGTGGAINSYTVYKIESAVGKVWPDFFEEQPHD